METVADYWFSIEPYVYVSVVEKCALLYNTLDGVTIESDKNDVVALLQEMLQDENCGVVLLKNERYKQKNINAFIRELREKYMGDIINVTLSKVKPVQVLPYINYPQKLNGKYDFSLLDNILDTLSEISIHIDHTIDIAKLILFLQSIPPNLIFNIKSDSEKYTNYDELFSFLNRHSSPKNILCSYTNIISLEPVFKNKFSYKISVHFPIDMHQWDKSVQILHNQDLLFEYVFCVTSLKDSQQVERLVEEYQIEKYSLKPIYTGDNIDFFEENVFLTKEDILSISMSIKDFFFKQNMNTYDFGKINIMPNGDAYASVNHPVLGNIYIDNIFEIVRKELDGGQSWLRIRDEAPCCTCNYQWLCPSPSNYERVIGRPNLCHVK